MSSAPIATDVLVCIYTCERDRKLLENLYRSPVGEYLRKLPEKQVLEVYADPEISCATRRNQMLILKTPEMYGALSLKTFEMVRYCVQHFRFRQLLKIDVTVVQTRFEGAEYDGRSPIDLSRLMEFLESSLGRKEYDGFQLHAQVYRETAEKWASKKGCTIDYEKIFGAGPMPPYFSGKAYFLGWDFAIFISRRGAEMARDHVKYLNGAEDVMIGRLYQDFLGSPGQSPG